MNQAADQVEGRNPVRELLLARRREVFRMYLAEGMQQSDADELGSMAEDAGVSVRSVSRRVLDQMAESGAHQGVLVTCGPYPYCTVEDVLNRATSAGEDPFIVVAAHIQDPQNLGAIIRTSEEAGVHGVIIPRRRAAHITPAVVKASAGASEYMHVALVTNLVRTVRRLQEERIWMFAGDAAGVPVYDVNLSGAVGLCIGSEGEGVPRLLGQTCDGLVSVPSRGRVGSLNASAAGAVLMYEVVRRRYRGDG